MDKSPPSTQGHREKKIMYWQSYTYLEKILPTCMILGCGRNQEITPADKGRTSKFYQ